MEKERYDFETIAGPDRPHYRVRDKASDNRIATCFDRANAEFVVRALNALGQDYMTEMRSALAREQSEGT